jgi:hypothetical protein
VTKKDERYRRISVLEQAIAERGWSLQLKRAVAREFGVTTRTVDRYKAELIRVYRRELEGDELEAQRADFIGRLRGHQRACLSTGRMGPLASMMSLEARILGVEAPVEVGSSSPVEVVLRMPVSDDQS